VTGLLTVRALSEAIHWSPWLNYFSPREIGADNDCKIGSPIGDWRRWLAALGGGSGGEWSSGLLLNGECPLLIGTVNQLAESF